MKKSFNYLLGQAFYPTIKVSKKYKTTVVTIIMALSLGFSIYLFSQDSIYYGLPFGICWGIVAFLLIIYFRIRPLKWEEMNDTQKIMHVSFNGIKSISKSQRKDYYNILENRK